MKRGDMQLTDLLSIEKWIELEKEMSRRCGLDASIFDVDGIRITHNSTYESCMYNMPYIGLVLLLYKFLLALMYRLKN